MRSLKASRNNRDEEKLVGVGTAPITTTLPNLPTELILDIAEYLPASSYMSLSYTCRVIRRKMNASIAHVLGEKASTGTLLTAIVRNIRIHERLSLRAMLDRDGMTGLSRAYCHICKELHHCSLFSGPALRQLDTERRCLGSAGTVWFCPHKRYDYSTVTWGFKVDDWHRCGGGTAVGLYHSYYVKWSIMRMDRNAANMLTSEDVKEALRPLQAPICPHLRLSDACVAQSYSPDCWRIQWELGRRHATYSGCRCFACMSGDTRAVFDFCGAGVRFEIKREGDDGLRTLQLTISRMTGHPTSYTDRAWIAQVAQREDFEEYRRAWESTNAECCRRIGAVNLS